MIYEKIKRLAAKEGISIASLEKKLNIGNTDKSEIINDNMTEAAGRELNKEFKNK